jgi:fatty acid elongase 3
MNTLVHVPMYSYYVIATKTRKPWWGRYLTSMQIVQFVIDVTTSLPWLYFYYAGIACQGTLRMFWGGS